MYAPEEVDGSVLTPIADSWEGEILTTSVTDHAERIENGIDFSIDIPKKVLRARIELLVNGLEVNQPMNLWLNGQGYGQIAIEIPDLTDPGYDKTTSGVARFIGWREGVFLLKGEQLVVGENHFQFQVPSGAQVAIRDFLLQVEYTPD